MEGLTRLLLVGFLAAFLAWLAVAAVAVAGRLRYERRRALPAREVEPPDYERAQRRLRRRAAAHRTRRGMWRRVSVLRALARRRDPSAPRLLRRALSSGDPELAGAAVRILGELDADWAADQLIAALRAGAQPRSRIATQLDRLVPAIGPRLADLLDDADPSVRFWGAILLGRCPGVAVDRLVALTRDPDPNVRAAAVEALGEREEAAGQDAVRERLADGAWFVRVHACRAAARTGGLADAPRIARALRDPRWWVRAAAKDALRGFGIAVAGALLPYLEDQDPFARNGAAEVLQDVGFVDALSRRGAEGELLERIFVAGGDRLRDAAERRAEDASGAEAALRESAAS